MLKNIDPLLSGELLKTLDDMGHGDRPALVDRSNPAHASGCTVIQLRGASLLQAAEALLSVLPLDSFVEHPLERMCPDGDPATVTDIQTRLLRMASESIDRKLVYGAVERATPRSAIWTWPSERGPTPDPLGPVAELLHSLADSGRGR